MAMMESSPSQGMDNKSVGILWILPPVAMTGESSVQITKAKGPSFIQVSGPVTGCLQTSVVEALAISVVHTSVCPIFVFLALWFKAQSPRNVRDLNLLRHLLQLQVRHQEELARPWLARTTTERICCQQLSTQEAQMHAAASAPLMTVAWATPGYMTTANAG